MGPVIRMDNRIDKRIDFLMELEGKVVGLGVCRIPSIEANKIVKISQKKILRCCERHENSWKIRVLVNGENSGVVIEPVNLLNYTCIVFSYDNVDDCGSVVLKAKGLRSREKYSRGLLQRRWSFGLGSKRHREYRMHEEMYGLEDIDEPMRSEMEYYSLEYQEPFHVNNMKAAQLLTGSIKQETKLWENAIVGYIAAEDMKDYDVKQFVNEHWKNFGPFTIYELKPPFFLFDFTNENGRRKLLEHGQWFVCSRPFILKRWTPNLSLDPNCFLSTLPVWVRFPNLNLEFWSSDSIAKIASVVGRPLFTDESTALKKNLLCARVCIEVNPKEKLLDVVPILCDVHNLVFYSQNVEYDWIPQLCRHCQSLLHHSSTCFLAPNVVCSLDDDSCEQLSDEEKVLLQSSLPLSDGIYDSGNEVDAITNEADAKKDINICNNTSRANAIPESCDIDPQKRTSNNELQRTTNMELPEDGKNCSATGRLLGSGRSASERWFAYSKQKAMELVGTTNTWIAIMHEL